VTRRGLVILYRFHGVTTETRLGYGAVVVNGIARRQPLRPISQTTTQKLSHCRRDDATLYAVAGVEPGYVARDSHYCQKVRTDHTATLSCEDGNGNTVFTKEIEFTDFPLDEITLYWGRCTICQKLHAYEVCRSPLPFAAILKEEFERETPRIDRRRQTSCVFESL